MLLNVSYNRRQGTLPVKGTIYLFILYLSLLMQMDVRVPVAFNINNVESLSS